MTGIPVASSRGSWRQGARRRSRRAAATLLLLSAAGCAAASGERFVWVDDLEPSALTPPTYVIEPGDMLLVSVWNQEHLSGEIGVRSDGRVTLPLVGELTLAGETIPRAAEQIAGLLQGLVIDPKVTITVRDSRPAAISVLGEVLHPGSIPLLPRDTILDILAKAGGLTEFAATDAIYVIRAQPKPLRVRFDYDRLTDGAGRGIAFPLRDGDIVVVR